MNDIPNLTYTIDRPGPLAVIRGVVYHYQSVGQTKNWKASIDVLQKYVGKRVHVDFGEIDSEAISQFIRENLR